MSSDRIVKFYRTLYAIALRLFPGPFRDRFGEGMRQTFQDLCREHADAGRGLHLVVLLTFADTMIQIPKQHFRRVRPMRKGVVAVFAITGFILAIPAVAMRYSDEVSWTAFDFLVAGALLMGSGLAAEYIWRRTPNFEYRVASLLAIFTGLFMIWVNLAVGIIGNEDHPANELYGLVLLSGVAGAFFARLRPAGMAVAMFVTALAMAAVPVIAYFIWRPPLDMGLIRTITFNSSVALAFGASSRLYRCSATRQTPAARVSNGSEIGFRP